MFAKELKAKSVEELNAELSKLIQEQFKLKFQLKSGQLQNVSSLKKIRRDIARVRTVLAQAGVASQKDGE
jgi:large subunit ribosomal protein L29